MYILGIKSLSRYDRCYDVIVGVGIYGGVEYDHMSYKLEKKMYRSYKQALCQTVTS